MIPRASDYDEIVRVVQLYVDGFGGGEVAKFKEAFSDDAWIFFTDPEGIIHKHLIRESFEGWAASHSHYSGRFISVNQAGDVANVLLGFDSPNGPADSWVDFHSLLRIDGVWKITNKTATHASRAAWAGAQSSKGQDAPVSPSVGRSAT